MSKDLRNRILITVALLALVQIISYIPIPLFNIKYLFGFVNERKLNFSFFQTLTLKQFSVTALGISPYLSASILVMTIFYLFRFRKGVTENTYKLHLCTAIVTIIILIVQGMGLAYFYQSFPLSHDGEVLVKTSGILFAVGFIASLSGGTLLVVWIAHIISTRGIGNGLIMIIGFDLVGSWLPSSLKLLKNSYYYSAEKLLPFFIIVALLLIIVAIIELLLSNWSYEIKLLKGHQPNRPFSLKFPLLLVGIFPMLFVSDINFTFGIIKMQRFGLPLLMIIIDIIFILAIAFIYTLVLYQPKHLKQIKSRLFPDSNSNNGEKVLAFDQKLLRIFAIYSISMLLIWGIASILEAWLTTRLKTIDFHPFVLIMNLMVLIAIIIDVYYQIKAQREMQTFYSAADEEIEPLSCEECNEKVTSNDEYCRACGANFVAEAKCSHHSERAANYRCVACSKPLCEECSILIMGSHRCADHQSVEVREGWAKVHVAATYVETQFIEQFFSDNNIASKCLSNVMGSNYGTIKLWQLTPIIPFMVARWLGGGEIKIFVPAKDFQRALILLSGHLSSAN